MHVVVEYVRNVLGFRDAAHQELDPDAATFAVRALRCSLAGEDHIVALKPGSQAAVLYGQREVVEPFFCRYGLNPEFAEPLDAAGLVISGSGEDGEARLVELSDHPFFVASLFVPQARSQPGAPHPLLRGFVAAARSYGLT